MYVLEMLVRGIRSLKDAFPEGRLAWLPERLQRDFKAQAQAVGTQGTQARPGTCSRTQLACALLSPYVHFLFALLERGQTKDICPRLELQAYQRSGWWPISCWLLFWG